MKISEIHIQNFKGFKDEKVENVGDLNIFIGKNNSGKSTVLQALDLFYNQPWSSVGTFNKNLHADWFYNKNLENEIIIGVTFELSDGDFGSFIPERLSDYMKNNFKPLEKISFSKRIRYGEMNNNIVYETYGLALGEYAIITNNRRFESHEVFPGLRNNISSGIDEIRKEFIDLRDGIRPKPKYLMIPAVRKTMPENRGNIGQTPTPEGSHIKTGLIELFHGATQKEKDKFSKIHETIKDITPEKLILEPYLKGNNVDLLFRKGETLIPISASGTGIDELVIMIFSLIYFDDYTFGIEEPEIHLHAEVQKRLLNFLRREAESRQIFIATHSPTFVDYTKLDGIYLLSQNDTNKITGIKKREELNSVLNELGVRRSTIFLSDKVLFVEGPRDREIFNLWADALGKDFADNNIEVIEIEGSDNMDYFSKSVLAEHPSILQKPYLFIMDRDEKTDYKIAQIKKRIKHCHVLNKREIENYLVLPEIILFLLEEKGAVENIDDPEIKEKELERLSRIMNNKIEELKSNVFINIVRVGIRGRALISNEDYSKIASKNRRIDPDVIASDIYSAAMPNILSKTEFKKLIYSVVNEENEKFEKMWNSEIKKERLISGKRLLEAIFKEYNLTFRPEKDNIRLAKKIAENDLIDEEIKGIIKKI